MQVAEKHGSLKVVVYEGLKWHHKQALEDFKHNKKPSVRKNTKKAAVRVCANVFCSVNLSLHIVCFVCTHLAKVAEHPNIRFNHPNPVVALKDGHAADIVVPAFKGAKHTASHTLSTFTYQDFVCPPSAQILLLNLSPGLTGEPVCGVTYWHSSLFHNAFILSSNFALVLLALQSLIDLSRWLGSGSRAEAASGMP